VKILIVDDHAMIRSGLKQLCTTLWNAHCLEAADADAALRLQKSERPQMTILDLNMPGVGGLELLRRLLATDPNARVVVFSMLDEPVYAAKALSMGARGYLSKSTAPKELGLALTRIANGQTYVQNDIAQQLATGAQHQALSGRDLEILRLLGEGRNLTEIALALGVRYKTVANCATSIKSKLGVARTSDLIRLSVEMGIARDR